MNKTNESTVTVNFDKLPKDIGKMGDGRRLLNPDDMPKILRHMSDQIGVNTDIVILCGYLPAFMWIQIGAELMDYPQMKIEYRARNGMSCELPAVCGV